MTSPLHHTLRLSLAVLALGGTVCSIRVPLQLFRYCVSCIGAATLDALLTQINDPINATLNTEMSLTFTNNLSR